MEKSILVSVESIIFNYRRQWWLHAGVGGNQTNSHVWTDVVQRGNIVERYVEWHGYTAYYLENSQLTNSVPSGTIKHWR
ncbi:hypothetical protein PABG_11609 [Paracoccidioides brasiliensis Pb03]|nr:hypothetical protein PABG_11609 [Paracoccidioides brasiliensis Pb03]